MYRIFWLFILLSGCIPVPKERRPCVPYETPRLDKTVAEGLEHNLLTLEPFPANWWEMFEDTTLSSLIEKAFERNPTLQEAMATVKRACHEARVERSALFPTLQLTGLANYQHLAKYGFFRAYAPTIPPNVTEYTCDLDFTHEFDFWGKHRSLYYAAIDRIRAREAETAQSKLLISTGLAATYFKLQAAHQELSLLEEEEKALVILTEMRKKRRQHALDSLTQVLEAESALTFVQQQCVVGRQNVELLKHALLNWIGEGPEEGLESVPKTFGAIVKVPIPDSLPCDLLASRPDVRAQIWRVEAAAQETGAAKADFYPNINLHAFAGLDTIFIHKWLNPGSIAWNAAPALHLPIFTAKRITANWQASQAALEEEIHAYERLLLEAAKEVADGLVNLQTAKDNLALQNNIVENRLALERLTDRRLTHALNNALDSWEAYLAVLQQKRLEVDATYRYSLALIELKRALGGGV